MLYHTALVLKTFDINTTLSGNLTHNLSTALAAWLYILKNSTVKFQHRLALEK